MVEIDVDRRHAFNARGVVRVVRGAEALWHEPVVLDRRGGAFEHGGHIAVHVAHAHIVRQARRVLPCEHIPQPRLFRIPAHLEPGDRIRKGALRLPAIPDQIRFAIPVHISQDQPMNPVHAALGVVVDGVERPAVAQRVLRILQPEDMSRRVSRANIIQVAVAIQIDREHRAAHIRPVESRGFSGTDLGKFRVLHAVPAHVVQQNAAAAAAFGEIAPTAVAHSVDQAVRMAIQLDALVAVIIQLVTDAEGEQVQVAVRIAIEGLGTLGGDNSSASAVNDAGDIVGEAVVGMDRHAFLWRGGAFTDLGLAGAMTFNTSGQLTSAPIAETMTPAQLGYPAGVNLSLIHISEPTRPY